VDDARDIRRKAEFAPLSMRYKIWIIDECHALSPQAWQALLKVIEEPPSHVIFIFCTTEDGKVPPTIKSRCFCFRFSSLLPKDIVPLLRRIAEEEKIDVSEEVLRMVASGSKGGVRTAVKALDHLQNLGDKVSSFDVMSALGTPARGHAREFVDSLVVKNERGKSDYLRGLKASSASVSAGVAVSDFMTSVAEYCHDMLVCNSQGFDMEAYGYDADEITRVRQTRGIVEKICLDSTAALRLIRNWVDTIDSMARMTVYNVQPQHHLDVMWVGMLNDLAMAAREARKQGRNSSP
jgi:DNA polymerase III subunit gamma/tau